MNDSNLEKFLSENEDLKLEIKDKTVSGVMKTKDGFIVQAFDNRYLKALQDHAAKLSKDLPQPSSPSSENDKEYIEAIRNSM